jgi:hypothetical protein
VANELELTYQGSATIYAVIRRHDDSKVYNAATAAFDTWADESLGDYDIALTDEGGDLYQGDWPADITAGQYRVMYYQQSGGSPATSDLLLATTDAYWNGSAIVEASSVELDDDALTTLARVKRFMRIDDAAHDTLLTELINRISDRIERLCGRRFKSSAVRERIRPAGRRMVFLTQYPVTRVDRIASGRACAMIATFTGTGIRAAVGVSDTAMRLTIIDADGNETNTDLDFDTYPTTNALAAAINAHTGWSATTPINTLSELLHPTPNINALNVTVSITYPNQHDLPRRILYGEGILELEYEPAGGIVLVEYTAGYATIPDDLEQIAIELVAEAFRLGRRDLNVESERLGDYSQKLASAVRITDGQTARLRPYMRITFATD